MLIADFAKLFTDPNTPCAMSTYIFNQAALIHALNGTALQPFAQALSEAVLAQGHALKHGHLDKWHAAVHSLPASTPCSFSVRDGAVVIEIETPSKVENVAAVVKAARVETDIDVETAIDGETAIDVETTIDVETEGLKTTLQALMPWRKGPFQFGPVFIDTEWRSDWKWNRLKSHISPLKGKAVLDVGCGSGYHLWRMRHEGAKLVLGIDPSLLYVKQFEATQHFIQDSCVHLLPLPMEALPQQMQVFDTVFSMGVLYHRRDPHSHLQQLQQAMTHQGELVLETLVVPGNTDDSLVIDGRYANMRNIYELPTVRRLCRWMEEAGFSTLKVADVTATSRKEQRSTHWMTSHSLAQALDANDAEKTIEGHPRPLRAIVVCAR